MWELSVEKNVGTKADSDYRKRTTTPDRSPTTDCTYVAASLRRWKARADWARDRTAEKRWAEVRAYGVDDVETWFETALVTWAWISERLGVHPTGLRSAESWWDSWSTRTTPLTPSALVLAGRTTQADALAERLSAAGQVTTISGASRDEILAFVAAVGIEQTLAGSGQLLARTAFVDDIHSWRRLVDHPSPLVLVPLADGLADEIPSHCVHHIVVPAVGSAVPDLELSPIDGTDAAAALKATGEVEDDRAAELGRLARRSLEIEREGGLDEVRRLAERSVVPWAIGVGLADATGKTHEDSLLPQLDEADRSAGLELAHAFFARRFSTEGWPWLESLLADHPDLTARQQARLLLATRDIPKVWQVADERGDVVADQYWRLFGYVGLGRRLRRDRDSRAATDGRRPLRSRTRLPRHLWQASDIR